MSHYDRDYYEANKSYYKAYYLAYHSKPNNKLKGVIRTRYRKALLAQRLDPKIDDPLELLGIDIEEYVSYIEGMMKPGMLWENFGNRLGCHSIDHVVPLSALNLSDKKTRKFAFNWKNTDCLWQSENKAKGNLVDISKLDSTIKLRFTGDLK
jgi:hypothetical protein